MPRPEQQQKKKFGKNLNKLVQPTSQAPPIAAAPHEKWLSGNASSAAAGRHGLLLLSAQKKPNGSSLFVNHNNNLHGGTTTAAKEGGENGTHSSGVPRSITTSGSTSSSHGQHLLYESTASTHDVLLSAVRGASELRENPHQAPDAWGVQQQLKQQPIATVSLREVESKEAEEKTMLAREREERNGFNHHGTEQQRWDDYGRRDMQNDAPSEDMQYTYMTQLAKERMDKRQQEEEARMQEQKQRAAARLRLLDEKTAQNSPKDSPKVSVSVPSWDSRDRGTTQHRTLWDPSSSSSATPTASSEKARPEPTSRPTLVPAAETAAATATTTTTNGGSTGPVIHLSSYEDRDRGERNASTGPRMLFDPKSGSMVAVKSKDETATSRKKERSKKPRKEREVTNGHTPEGDTRTGRRTKGRSDASNGVNSTKEAKTAEAKKKGQTRRRYPRTRGVLYTKDEKGTFVSADGCEGDLGYGCHSVPGGMVKNKAAYATYTQEQEEKQAAETDNMCNGFYDYGTADKGSQDSEGDMGYYGGFKFEDHEGAEENNSAEQEPLEWITANDKLELVTGGDDSLMLKPTAKAWAPSQAALAAAAAAAAAAKEAGYGQDAMQVMDASIETEEEDDLDHVDMNGCDKDDGKTHDGLGFDPTHDMNGLMLSDSLDGDEEDDEDDPLGAVVDLEALGLEPSLFAADTKEKNGSSAPRHIFSFETSGTWGNVVGEATGDTGNDWNVSSILGGGPTTSSALGGLFGPGGMFRDSGGDSGPESNSDPTALLSNITPISTWGPPRGLGGIALNGESAKATTGD